MLFCFIFLLESFHFIYFTVEVKLLYIVVLVSPVQQSESAICIHILPPSWASLPPPLIPPHHSRSSQSSKLSWAPCAIQQVPISHWFYTWQCIWYAFRFRQSSPYSKLVPSYRVSSNYMRLYLAAISCAISHWVMGEVTIPGRLNADWS